jgi:hypothetical protein
MYPGIQASTHQPVRRELHFERIGDLLVDVESFGDRVPQAMGHWTAPQNVDHVVRVIDASMDGFVGRRPRFLRLIAPLIKKRALSKRLPAGVKIPAGIDGLAPDSAVRWDDAVLALRQSIDRFRDHNAMAPNPILGQLSHNEWEQLHCRHGELHFSFLKTASYAGQAR